jgi:hypothetical protein
MQLVDHIDKIARDKGRGLLFCYLPLDLAMKNKHHDEPGFWDRWADNF